MATGWCSGRTATCDPFASRRRVNLRCFAQDESADQRHSGRDWIPDGTAEVVVCCRGSRGGLRSRHRSAEVAVVPEAVEPLVLRQRLPQL